MAEQKNTKDNQFSAVVGALMENASILMTSKTVIGDPITVGDTIIIPLSDVSVGCGAGSGLPAATPAWADSRRRSRPPRCSSSGKA